MNYSFKQKSLLTMKNTVLTFVLLIVQLSTAVYSQKTISLSEQGVTIREALKIIENNSDFRFFYNTEFKGLSNVVSINSREQSVENVLDEIFTNLDITYRVLDNNVIVITPAGSQEKILLGKVEDSNTGESLIGVNILVEGTSTGTITAEDGSFSLVLEEEQDILIFSYVGYITQRISVGNQTTLDIYLSTDLSELEEVVVIGYGTQKKSDLTGSVARVSSDIILSTPVTSAAEAIRGRVAGVDVTNGFLPGSSPTILIRGKNSISGTNAPLWVIDGIPIQGRNIDINPSDIETMDILKDASATAIYGSRGSNGVIIVTTKRASAADPLSLTYDGYFGVKRLAHKLDKMNGEQWAEFTRETYRAVIPVEVPDDQIFDEVQLESLQVGRETDWVDLVLDNTGFSTSHNLGMSVNGEKSNTSASVGYYHDQSIIEKANFSRFNVKLNSELNVSKRISPNCFGEATLNSTPANSIISFSS